MARTKDPIDARHASDSDGDFAGYDPYIVALTGGTDIDRSSADASSGEHSTESRKVQLVTWLRDHSA